jgi:hypothetical protein
MKYRVILLALLLAGCSKKETDSPMNQAPADISKSISPVNVDGQQLLKLKKSSLSETFLLITSLKTSAPAAEWNDLGPVIVSFEQAGSKLALMEAVPSAYDAIKAAPRLLATFAVTDQTADEITFAWDLGIQVIPNVDNMGSGESANDAEAERETGNEKTFAVKESFTRSALIKNNEIHIEQAIRYETQTVEEKIKTVAGQKRGKPELKTLSTGVTARFSIRPYVKSKTFHSQLEDASSTVGFFTTPVLAAGDGKFENHVMKWDLDPSLPPVTYVISSNTPEPVRAAFAEGLQYWNHVIGREAFKISVGGDPDALPEDRTVMIRWVPWGNAPTAYGSIQGDPLTGEIIRGQIFFPESFVKKAKQSLSGHLENDATLPEASKALLTIPGLRSAATRCNIASREELSSDLDPSEPGTRRALLLDRIRSVVAHEMGHTLGLRHNFAASYASKLAPADQDAAGLALLTDPNAPGAAAASSVMDYTVFRDDLLIGRHIKENVLAYDRMAIGWAYKKEKNLDAGVSPYCTDEHVDNPQESHSLLVYGCSRGDSTANPLLGEVFRERRALRTAVYQGLEKQLSLLFPAAGQKSLSLPDLVKALADITKSDYDFLSSPRANQRLAQFFLNKKLEGGTAASQAISITQAKAWSKFSAPSNWPDAALRITLKSDSLQAGGFGALLLAGAGFDPATGLPDMAMAKTTIDTIYSEARRNGKTSANLPYAISAGDWNQLKAAVLDRYGKNLASSFYRNISDFFPSDLNTDYDADGGQTKYSTLFTNENSLDTESFRDLARALTLVYEAAGSEVAVSIPSGAVRFSVPALDSSVRQSLLKIYDLKLWGQYNGVLGYAADELIQRRIAWLQKVASIASPAPGITDPDQLLTIINQVAYSQKLIGDNVSMAASEEVAAIKYLRALK